MASERLWKEDKEKMDALLRHLACSDIGSVEEHKYEEEVLSLVRSRKWEVRRTVANVLGEFRHIDPIRVEVALSDLKADPQSYVQSAASRAISRRREAARGKRGSGTLTPVESQGDLIYEHMLAEIEKIELKGITHMHIYDTAISFGDRAYAELAADTAHEIGSLLTPLEGSLVQLRDHPSRSKDVQMRRVGMALTQLDRLKGLVESLQVYGTSQIGPFEFVDLADVVQEAMSVSLQRAMPDGIVSIELNVQEELAVNAVRRRLLRAFVNVCTNGLQAIRGDGVFSVTAERNLDQNTVELKFCDTGTGMTPVEVKKALRRFSSTHKDDGGTGLGLPITRKVIEQDHRGAIEINSRKGHGTTVLVTIPINCRSISS